MTTYFNYPSGFLQEELRNIAEALLQPGKGILAADETVSKIGLLFKDIKLENIDHYRRAYRQVLFTADKSIRQYVSGVILFHESLYQTTDNGIPFVELLRERGIIPGIKVDKGVVPLWGSEDEFTTQGLNDLKERCETYKKDGCHFAKWRCVFKINVNTPSYQAIMENAIAMARYASICQANRLVPIIEPDIIYDDTDDIERCQKVTEIVLAAVYNKLNDYHIYLEGTLLEPNMVTGGKKSPSKYSFDEIVTVTMTALKRTVPCAVMGISFLLHGKSEEVDRNNLNAINKYDGTRPWEFSFSFDLESSVIELWRGRRENVAIAQQALLNIARTYSDASFGKYCTDSVYGEDEFDEKLFVQSNAY